TRFASCAAARRTRCRYRRVVTRRIPGQCTPGGTTGVNRARPGPSIRSLGRCAASAASGRRRAVTNEIGASTYSTGIRLLSCRARCWSESCTPFQSVPAWITTMRSQRSVIGARFPPARSVGRRRRSYAVRSPVMPPQPIACPVHEGAQDHGLEELATSRPDAAAPPEAHALAELARCGVRLEGERLEVVDPHLVEPT